MRRPCQDGLGAPVTDSATATGSSRTAWLLETVAVALLGMIGLLALYLFATERAGLFKDDTRHYGLMADDPAYLPRLPYTLRVLTPGLVCLLPFDTATGFAVVTLTGLWLSTVALYWLVRVLGGGRWAAGASGVLFLGSGASIRLLTTPSYVDALTYLSEISGFICLALGRESWFSLVSVVGVLNRETALLLIPVYLLQQRSEGRLGRADLRRVAVVAGLPVLTLLLLAALKLCLAGGGWAVLSALETKPRTFVQNVPDWRDLADIYSVFGAGWLLALGGLRRAHPVLKRGLLFGGLVVAQLVVSRGDESRNLSHLLVLVLPLAALELERQPGLRRRWLALLGCLASAVNFRWTVLPLPSVRYVLVSVGSLLALGSRSPIPGVSGTTGTPDPLDRRRV